MTPAQITRAVVTALRRVPPRLRQWIYLALAGAGVVLLVVSWIQQGLSVEQIGYALVGLVGALARANVSPPPA